MAAARPGWHKGGDFNPQTESRDNDQEIKFNNDAVHQTYDVVIAKADGNRKVALATCESQSGDAQKACKDQAENDYKTARRCQGQLPK